MLYSIFLLLFLIIMGISMMPTMTAIMPRTGMTVLMIIISGSTVVVVTGADAPSAILRVTEDKLSRKGI